MPKYCHKYSIIEDIRVYEYIYVLKIYLEKIVTKKKGNASLG